MVDKIILSSAIFALSCGGVFAQDAGVEQPKQIQEVPKQAENQTMQAVLASWQSWILKRRQ